MELRPGRSDATGLDEDAFRYLCSCSLGWAETSKDGQEP